MIVFHEGLPRAGKSYEACVEQIIPALKQGRAVITNIEGINHAKFSEVTGIPEKMLFDYLVCVDHADIPDIQARCEAQKASFLELTQKDSLVVIDEVQNLFPSTRQKLDPEWQRFITEHGHDGLDIILMGQDRRDCHNLWRRRIESVVTFLKQTALGRPTHYYWEVQQSVGVDKFQKVSGGSKKYEEKYFGLYSSHTEGTTNKATKIDDRVNVFKTFKFKAFLVCLLLLPIYGYFGISSFIDDSAGGNSTKENSRPAESSIVLPQPVNAQPVAPVKPAPKPEPEPEPALDVFHEAAKAYDLRLSGFVHGIYNGKLKILGNVEVLDDSLHLKDVYDMRSLIALGWTPTIKPYGLDLAKGGVVVVVRPWPVDSWGKVNQGATLALK